MNGNLATRSLIRTTLIVAALAVLSLPAFATVVSQSTPAAGAAVTQRSRVTTQVLPPALRPVFYQTLAKNAGAAYRLNEEGCATLPKSSLKGCFDSHGAHFAGKAMSLSLHLVAFGRGETLSPMKAVYPAVNGNRVSYTHGNLTEWWRMLPMGFEQGFTVQKRPAGRGELILALAASNKAERHNAVLAWGELRYGNLVVTDAKGKVIPATLKSKGDRILIAVNDTHAAYPLIVDPLVWIEQKVTASDGAAQDQLGRSVAIDGATALLGAQCATYDPVTLLCGPGATYVFTESNGIWSEEQKLTANDGADGDQFGISVAISGSTALVGAWDATVNGNVKQGAAYVFTNTDGIWTQTQKLTASDLQTNCSFGQAVALSGSTALIGAAPTVPGAFLAGRVYAFTESGGTWTQTQEFNASDGAAGDAFGQAIALSGTTALIGSIHALVNGNKDGAAYVFNESDGTWNQTAKLVALDSGDDNLFGLSVSLDDTTALVGAPFAQNFKGAAYVFNESDGTWSQTQELTGSDDVPFDEFGWSVALSGMTAIVGAYAGTVGSNLDAGVAYVFTNSNDTWTQKEKLNASDGASFDNFGSSVALDGTTALIGADTADVNGNTNQGAAYFEGQSDLGLAVSAPQAVGQGQQYTSQAIATNNASAASPAVTATVTVPAAASFVSASASQGTCSEDSGVVSCDFGQINGNAGTATANVTLKAVGAPDTTIENTASVAKATPPLSASAPTTITEGGACSEGYSEYDGNLNPGERAHSPIYRAPAGEENAILTGPTGFQLFAVFQNAQGRKIYRIPGNEVHRQAPAGYFTWVVKAGDTGGAYTLCVLHP